MRIIREFLTSTLVGGLLIVLPIYLTVLILLKGMQSVAALVRPLTTLLPTWLPAENVLSLALVLVVCFLIGIAVRTRAGGIVRQWMDGANDRFTVFVPSVPTPLAGAVYILNRERVHPLDVSFTQAIGSISRWGSGSKELVAAMPKA